MKKLFAIPLTFLILAGTVTAGTDEPVFEVSFASTAVSGPLTGRMFLVLARESEPEPRLQVGRYGVQFFGTDFEDLSPGEPVVFDVTTLGYPASSLGDLPPGRYYVQAVMSIYTRFDRADDHTLWMHMDQWEGQDWRRSPGNLYSDVMLIDLEELDEVVRLTTNRVIPPVEALSDTKWVKRVKFKSEILSDFWGHPIYLGATVLLPKGYEDHPDSYYPTVYHHGHFSLRPPLRFSADDDNKFFQAWTSKDFPRFAAVTIQHPTPYFDDSYAVNSANNGPFGDAIHEELIPLLEKEFRLIAEPYARLLTGGSTGGWESFALQVFYPDFYGGTWSFSPDPLDFRNVEGINIYEDENAFYKQHDWYQVPIANTRDHETGAVRLTSEQRNRMELVNGTSGRSGEQLDIWSAVFGPVGEDGYFEPLFDKWTGQVNPEVAEYWRDNYDLRHILQRDWESLGPKLVGKLHVFCGRMDDYYLNFGVYFMEEFLEETTNPYYEGSFTYGDTGGHSWRPFNYAQLLRIMAEHIRRNAPDDAHIESWNY